MHRRSHPRLESPIEEQFWQAWQQRAPHIPLETQYPACGGAYRLDFAHLPSRIAIELDGFTHHSSHARFTQDRKRNRDLQRDGWRVLTFSGSEIFHHVTQCVDEVRATIEQAHPATLLPAGAMPSSLASWPAALLPTAVPPPRSQRALLISLMLGAVALCILCGVIASLLPNRSPWRVAQQASATERPLWQIPTPTQKLMVLPQPVNRRPTPQLDTPLPDAVRSAIVTAPELNIRRDPQSEAPVVATVPINTGVNIHQEHQVAPGVLWVQVSTMHNGRIVIGWANAGYLR